MPSNFSRLASRKKQTRLVLEPVVSSPRAKNSGVAPQVRFLQGDDDTVFPSGKRYAVVIESSRNVRGNNDSSFLISHSESSQLHIGGRNSDNDLDIHPFRLQPPQVLAPASRSRPNLESRSEQPRFYDGADDDSAGTRSSPPKKMSARMFLAGGSSYNAPVPSPGSTPASLSRKSKTRGKVSFEQSGSRPPSQPDKPIKKTPRSTLFILSDEDDDGSDELPDISDIDVLSDKKRKPGEAVHSKALDEEDEDIFVRSSRKRTTVDGDKEPVSPLISKKRKTINANMKEGHTPTAGPRIGKDKSKDVQQRRHITRSRGTRKIHRTAAQKKLELLRRRRAGEDITEVTSSESDERPLYDSTTDALSEFYGDEGNGSDDEIEKVRESLRVGKRNRNDDDFVVDDEDESLGIPGNGLHDIPLQFTHQAHKPLKEHFRDAIDWMVQKKINPGFASTDEIYLQAFRKLGNEVGGYAISKYLSPVWDPKFLRTLNARPTFIVEPFSAPPGGQSSKCEACNRSGYPASFRVKLRGKAYNKDTLEEFDGDDDSDSSSVDSRNEPIMGEQTSWLLGRFCKANAETAHALVHWKRTLNEWVVDRLKAEGHMSPENLAARADWSKKQLRRYADNIVDNWSAGITMRTLYADFKLNLEKARNFSHRKWG